MSWNYVSREASVPWDGEAGVRETVRRLVWDKRLPRIRMRSRVWVMNGRQSLEVQDMIS